MASVSHRGVFASGDPGIGPEGPTGPQGPQGPAGDGSIWVSQYGAVPGGDATVTTAAIQAAIDANPGREIKLIKGQYLVNSTLFITERGTRLVGEVCARASANGTEIFYSGTGPVVEIGEDDGEPYDDSEYNGVQDHWFENLYFRTTGNTPLDNGINQYKAGTYGIRDWFGGGLRLYNVAFEQFEYSFWGVQSDISDFSNILSIYSRYGMYFGPASDQVNVDKLLTFYCDTAIVLDRCSQFRLVDAQIVGCGTTDMYAVEIRKGTDDVRIVRPWFENFDVTDMVGWVGAGLVDGYGPDGVGTTTDSAKGISIDEPFVYTTAAASPGHAKCLVGLGAAIGVYVHHPETKVGASINNLDALIIAPAGTAFTFSESNAHVSGVNSNSTLAKVYLNQGSGSPNVSVAGMTGSGMTLATTTAAGLTIKRLGGSNLEDLQIGAQGLSGRVFIVSPNKTDGPVNRLHLDRSIQMAASSALPPAAGVHQRGDRYYYNDPTSGGAEGVVCTVGGTPGTWEEFGIIA